MTSHDLGTLKVVHKSSHPLWCWVIETLLRFTYVCVNRDVYIILSLIHHLVEVTFLVDLVYTAFILMCTEPWMVQNTATFFKPERKDFFPIDHTVRRSAYSVQNGSVARAESPNLVLAGHQLSCSNRTNNGLPRKLSAWGLKMFLYIIASSKSRFKVQFNRP